MLQNVVMGHLHHRRCISHVECVHSLDAVEGERKREEGGDLPTSLGTERGHSREPDIAPKRQNDVSLLRE